MTEEPAPATNRHHKGRDVPDLPTFTFATGITIQYQRISPVLFDDIKMSVREDFPPPPPPMNDVEYGDQIIKEPNYAHPIYQRRLKEWEDAYNLRIGEKIARLVIKRGVVCTVDIEAVQQVREQMKADNVLLPDDDKFVYITRVCVGSRQDIFDLTQAVSRRSIPTKEAVQAHAETFRSEVPG